MSSEPALRAEKLSKTYQVYKRPHHRLQQMLWRGRRRFFEEFSALSDVSFEVARGETMGIVGRNGSGKSTLLQIIAGTLTPTAGKVQVSGRVAALLELGSGFNPDFTGRENVYLNASILGLTRQETDARYEDIVAFADIGDFMDQPVKTYSSGMYVRLAFATAVNVSPDVLIVDEALAVGDESFQRKCFARIKSIQEGGGTILFVSHSAASVVHLCDRAMLLERGERLLSGRPKLVVSKYQTLINATPERQAQLRAEIKAIEEDGAERLPAAPAATRSAAVVQRQQGTQGQADIYDPGLVSKSVVSFESRGARIRHPALSTVDGRKSNILARRQEYIYSYTVDFTEPAEKVGCGMMIKTVSGVEIGGGTTLQGPTEIQSVQAGETIRVEFRFGCNLAPGTYFLNAGVSGVVDGERVFLHRVIDAVAFRVETEERQVFIGLVDLFVRPEVIRQPRLGEPAEIASQ